MTLRFFALLLSVIFAITAVAGCNSDTRKLVKAESSFDSGDYENAQFLYFELISTGSESKKDEIVESYYQRVSKLVVSSSFEPSSYPEWVAVLDSVPNKKLALDELFTQTLIKRADAMLKKGETVESAVLIGFVPEGQSDAGLTEKIARAHELNQEKIYNQGLQEYKSHEYESAIETWSNLDISSEWGKKVEEIKTRIPKEKEAYYLSEAKKRKVEGLRITAAGPVNRVVFNRIQGRTLESEPASDGRQILRIEAVLTKDIALYAWYKENENFKSLGELRREFVWLEAEDPEKIKKMYKQIITPENPVEVVYFLNTAYDFCKYNPVYVSTEMIPRVVDDLNEIAIIHQFK